MTTTTKNEIQNSKNEIQNSSSRVNSFQLENENVHKVYNEIAQHFSNTRYKPWPIVDEYLK